MGTDIHAHVEIRYNGEWVHWAQPKINRWYELFGKLAGVRGESPIVEPKGFPKDASISTRLSYEHMGVDAHTPSWFNEEELDRLSEWLREYKEENAPKDLGLNYDLEYGILSGTYLFGNGLTSSLHYDDVDYVPEGVDGVRLVFWFDC